MKKRGAKLPNPVIGYPGRTLCITVPDHPLYLQAFWGHLHQLGKWWNWENGENLADRRAKAAAEMWRQFLHTSYQAYLLGEPCGEGGAVEFQMTADCLLQYRNAPTDAWSNVPGWATFALACFQGAPGAPGEDGRTPEIRMTVFDADTKHVEWKYTDEPDNIPGIWRLAGSVNDGAKGDKGDKGDTGATGAQGIPGEPGHCEDCPEPPIGDICNIAGGTIGALYDALAYFFQVWRQDAPTHDLVNPATMGHTVQAYPFDWIDAAAVQNLVAYVDLHWNLYGTSLDQALDVFISALTLGVTEGDMRCALYSQMTGTFITDTMINWLVNITKTWAGQYANHMDVIADLMAQTTSGSWAQMVNLASQFQVEYDCTTCRTEFCPDPFPFTGTMTFDNLGAWSLVYGVRTGTGTGSYIGSRVPAGFGSQMAEVRYLTTTPGYVSRVRAHTYVSAANGAVVIELRYQGAHVAYAEYIANTGTNTNIITDYQVQGIPVCCDEIIFSAGSGDWGNTGNATIRLLDITIN